MTLNIDKEVAAMRRKSVGDLRERYAEVFGEPTRSYHKDYLVRKIAWQLQAREEGDLSERARARAAEIARDTDLRLRPPPTLRLVGTGDGPTVAKSIKSVTDQRLPMPGAMLTRVYRGQRINVRVLPRGFEFEGEHYRSLSAVAKKVTGTHWNGWLFFNVKPPQERRAAG